MRKKSFSPVDNKKPAGRPTAPHTRNERDPDEEVHTGDLEMGGEQFNEDPDDRVHKEKGGKPKQLKAEDNPQDPDDLVHDNDDEDDE